MSASQQHGLEVERQIIDLVEQKTRQKVPIKAPLLNEHTARFDIPAFMDPENLSTPTSIKTAKWKGEDALICMADASRIAYLSEMDQTRLLVALYCQEGAQKKIIQVRQYMIKGSEWSAMMGHVDPQSIGDFHQAIKVKDSEKARKVAKMWQVTLQKDFPSDMRWNPKIDSGHQRRLQCSIPISLLERHIKDKSRIKVFGVPLESPEIYSAPKHLTPRSSSLWGWNDPKAQFPWVIDSPARVRHERVTKPSKSMDVKASTKIGKKLIFNPQQATIELKSDQNKSHLNHLSQHRDGQGRFMKMSKKRPES